MSFLDAITPIVLTWNEEPNVQRTFDRLWWAREVAVVDSGSTDRTIEILGTYANVRVSHQSFVSFAEQWNRALADPNLRTEWVLTLDADYVLSEDFVAEIRELQPPTTLAAYEAPFVYWSLGQPLRASLYPPRAVLFRASRGTFRQEGHKQVLSIRGPSIRLRSPIHHDDRKSLGRWLQSQASYARLEADRIAGTARRPLVDRIRRTGVTPFLAAAYALFVKGVLLDGRAGAYYATQRAVAEALLSLELWGRR